jgi:hypothetical protein
MQMTHTAVVLVTVLSAPAVGATTQAREAAPAPVLRFVGDAVTVAMPLKGDRHMLQVTIGSEGPFDFFIDTGSAVSVIDARIASRLGLVVTGTVPIGAPGGGTVDAGVVAVPVLRVGDLEIQSAAAVTIELSQFTGGLMQGILGMDVFREVLLTLDPAHDRAVVSRDRLAPGNPGVVRLNPNRENLGFEIDVVGHSFAAHIDTGAPDTFSLPLAAMDGLPLAGPERRASAALVGSTRDVRSRQLDGAIRFAGLTYERPWVSFVSPSPPAVNIGSEILDRLVTRIDQASGLVAFTASAAPAPAGAAPRQLGLRLGGPGADLSTVGSVDGGSLAEQAGLRAGDTIRTLNGRPMSEYDPATLGTLMRGSEPLTFEVDRDGRRAVVTIP